MQNYIRELSNQSFGWPIANPGFSSGNRFIMTQVLRWCFYVRLSRMHTRCSKTKGVRFLVVSEGSAVEFIKYTIPSLFA